jgi:hypothetical protein
VNSVSENGDPTFADSIFADPTFAQDLHFPAFIAHIGDQIILYLPKFFCLFHVLVVEINAFDTFRTSGIDPKIHLIIHPLIQNSAAQK